MVVSAGAVQGRAVVMAVSCWPTSVPAEVSLVSTSPSGRVLCTKKFTLLGLMVGASAKKFALQAQNGRKTLFSGALGEFFRGRVGGGAVLGEFCRTNRYCARSCRQRALPACNGGGFALHEAVAQRVASVSDPHVVQFPPLLSVASGFVRARGLPCVLMGAHTLSLRSRNVTVSQVCSRHIQRRLCHRIRAGTPAQGASITSTTTRHDRERSPHNPGSQPAGYTTQHRAPEPVGCEPRSSDGSPPSQRADHTDHNDQATQSNSR